jgi:hypothetical protein
VEQYGTGLRLCNRDVRSGGGMLVFIVIARCILVEPKLVIYPSLSPAPEFLSLKHLLSFLSPMSYPVSSIATKYAA